MDEVNPQMCSHRIIQTRDFPGRTRQTVDGVRQAASLTARLLIPATFSTVLASYFQAPYGLRAESKSDPSTPRTTAVTLCLSFLCSASPCPPFIGRCSVLPRLISRRLCAGAQPQLSNEFARAPCSVVPASHLHFRPSFVCMNRPNIKGRWAGEFPISSSVATPAGPG